MHKLSLDDSAFWEFYEEPDGASSSQGAAELKVHKDYNHPFIVLI